MHIKQVIIQGIRSYREQTILEPFSPRHNVIIGKNGSGKSNFFYGIEFVLGDEYSSLRPEQRHELLHIGTGPRALNGFVEIIFDNRDHRLPVEEDEVSIKRVIGTKKDQYFLNKKMITRTAIVDFLENAGFSRCNPYYIVKQGKINKLAIASGSQRLALLRELAGTMVYDERRKASKKILKQTEELRDNIKDLLQHIENKSNTLEEEKEELKTYQKWDKMKRSVEYIICDHDLKDTSNKLEELNFERKASGRESEGLRDKLKDASKNVKRLETDRREAETYLRGLQNEHDILFLERDNHLKEKNKLELNIRDQTSETGDDDSNQKRLQKELESLKETIQTNVVRLGEIQPRYEELKHRVEHCTRDLHLKEQKRNGLYAKLDRGSRFASKEVRDEWIRTELESLQRAIVDTRAQIKTCRDDLNKNAEGKIRIEGLIRSLTEKVRKHCDSIDRQNKNLPDTTNQKDTLQTKRHETWRQANVLQQKQYSVKEELSLKNRALRSVTSMATINGHDSITKVLQYFREQGGNFAQIADGYYGMLIENFDCDRSLYTAVEVTSGNKLFYHIVENDHIGTQILKEMNTQKLPGEVTFMPLNRLISDIVHYPDTPDAVPLINKLNYDEKVREAVNYVYGKTLICRDLEVATQIARTTNLNCITFDGDRVSNRGALTGGYFDPKRSRMDLHRACKELENKLAEQEGELIQYRKTLEDIDAKISKVVNDMQNDETKVNKAKFSLSNFNNDIRSKKDEMFRLDEVRQVIERSLASLDLSLTGMESKEQLLHNELQQELLTQLSGSDQQELDKLNEDIHQLIRESKGAFNEMMSLEVEKNITGNVNNQLNRRKEEVEFALQEITLEDRNRRLEDISVKLHIVNRCINDVNEKIGRIGEEIDSQDQELNKMQEDLEKQKSVEQTYREKLYTYGKDLDELANKLNKKKEECMKRMRDLGPLPSDAFHKYNDLSSRQLFQHRNRANRKLKRYDHVNKKALDQYVNFSEQREKLMKRMDELTRGYEAIVELMNVLDLRKYEAIQFTFKQVSKFFGEVFKALVPLGCATLVMETGETVSQDLEPSVVKQFVGVGIRVSFTGQIAEMKEMQQLSGGQKSLVALALIFAIQKCDPAPFYLFDEIDQALDIQHRKAVADMIHELSKNSQFITTTFRAQLLEKAHRFYGVVFRDNVSHIKAVTKEEATDFLEDDTV